MSDSTEAAKPEVLDRAEPTSPPDPGPIPGRDIEVQLEDGTRAALTPSRNYSQAVVMGRVLAESGYFSDARDPAKAAVKVMFGMDMGISPTAALSAIHLIESDGRMVPLIEGKVLGAILKSRPDVDYDVTEYTDEAVTIVFKRKRGKSWRKLSPEIRWTEADSQRAGLNTKKAHRQYPRTMKMWRALAEGQRLHFPEITMGSPIYVEEEMSDADTQQLERAALPPGAPPLTDERAEEQRAAARAVYAELQAINPDRVVPGRFHSMVSSAEHSHEQLDGVIAALTDLRDTEQQIVELRLKLEASSLPKTAIKAAVDRAERQGSNRERMEVLSEAIAEAGGDDAEAGPS